MPRILALDPGASITFTVPAVPVAQPRAKATTVNGYTRMYEASSKHPVNAYKATLRHAAAAAYSGPPLECPLAVRLLFVFTCKSKRERKPKATRPDCDNLAKSTLDALNGLTFADDSQVVRLTIEKWHAHGSEQPRVEITIEAA